jgi:hypothetical protein
MYLQAGTSCYAQTHMLLKTHMSLTLCALPTWQEEVHIEKTHQVRKFSDVRGLVLTKVSMPLVRQQTNTLRPGKMQILWWCLLLLQTWHTMTQTG